LLYPCSVLKITGYSGYTGYNPHEYWRFLLRFVTAVTGLSAQMALPKSFEVARVVALGHQVGLEAVAAGLMPKGRRIRIDKFYDADPE
jgi:hypothetical protein